MLDPYIALLRMATFWHKFRLNQRHAAADMNSRISHDIIYLVPYFSAEMVDPAVEKLTTEPWTRVISDNQLLRRLICSYFTFPHPCGPFVHKDLFLEDMMMCHSDFCSPLLVKAMLSIASVSTPPS